MHLHLLRGAAFLGILLMLHCTTPDAKTAHQAASNGAPNSDASVYDDVDPVWSPDGQHITFYSNRTGHFTLYTIEVDGSNLQPLTY